MPRINRHAQFVLALALAALTVYCYAGSHKADHGTDGGLFGLKPVPIEGR